MHWTTLPCAALLAASLNSCASPPTEVQIQTRGGGTNFAAPKLLQAGGVNLGSSSLYPSPVLLDIDQDGKAEMVIGGLRGYLSVSRRTAGGWGKEAKLKATDGKDLKFHNW